MKTYGGLYPQIYSFQNLLTAFHKARRGKGGQIGVAAFEYDLERHLLCLERELQAETYRPTNQGWV